MDVESIKKNYRNFEDYQIIDLANSDARSLRPEIIPVLVEEIKRRNLPENLLNGIQAQLKVPTPEEIDEYCSIIRNQACTDCQSKTHKLNAIVVKAVTSMIFLTQSTAKIKIVCPDCLEKHKSNANSKSMLLGWWAFPWGPIKTVQALISNSKMTKHIRLNHPNIILQSFVYENIGFLETNRENPSAIKQLLVRTNNPA